MSALRTTVTCLDGCGPLGDGLTGDQPGPKPRNWRGPLGDGTWTRWDELDKEAADHTEKEPRHPTIMSTTPVSR